MTNGLVSTRTAGDVLENARAICQVPINFPADTTPAMGPQPLRSPARNFAPTPPQAPPSCPRSSATALRSRYDTVPQSSAFADAGMTRPALNPSPPNPEYRESAMAPGTYI